MSQHEAAIAWQRSPHPHDAQTYDRNHVARLSGGQTINISASVEYKGDPLCADPEEMLVSAVASCHMLTFLAIAEYQQFKVERYQDNAVGCLEKTASGGMAITTIELSPTVVFGGDRQPDEAALNRLHAGAHKNCFISNSIHAKVTVVPVRVMA